MNNSFLKFWSFIIGIVLLGAMSACEDDDPPLPDNTVKFETDAVGFDDDETEKTFKLPIDRATTAASTITVSFTATGVTYGTHFTTDPAATSGSLTINIPAGATEASFKISKVAGLLLDNSAEVDFTIASTGEELVVGDKKALKLSFSSIVSQGSDAFELNGGTVDASFTATNAVYVDFSGNAQTSVDRTLYDLAFYNGAEFRVMLNYTSNATALVLDKNDIDAVTTADADGKSLAPGPGANATIGLYDAWTWTSDLTQTVIGEVSATDADNKVYLFKPAAPAGSNTDNTTWYKIRILRNGTTGYTLQYARLNATTHSSVNITKDAAYNFTFVSMATGKAVSFEPRKASWDIMWSYAAYYTQNYAYAFNDFVLINNTAGVSAVKVTVTDALTYASFNESNLAGLEFSNKRDAIGSGWRSTSTGIIKTQFYVVKDGAGNYYKLNFLTMGVNNDGGTRGKPVIQYALVKKAS